jgi:Tol biopolymer transport system component
MKHLHIFSIFSLMLLCANIFQVFAKTPTTPKILFTSTRDGNRDVYIMNLDGTEQVNLTQHRADDQQAVWSPTGEQILFVSDRGGVRDLYLMNPDGSNVQHYFKFKIEDWRTDPTWSPDGTQFAYERINWGNG